MVKYFNAQHIGDIITAALQSSFNRPVVIESIKLVSINAIEIKKLRIVDTELSSYNNFVSVDSVIVRYNLLPIIENKIEINEIILKNPSINIIKDEAGRINTPKLEISSKESELGQRFDMVSAGGRTLQIIIKDWILKNGTFSYRDLGRNISHSLNGISVHFHNLKFNAPTGFDLNFVLRNKVEDKIVETEIVSRGQVNLADFQLDKMALNDTNLEVRGFRVPLKINLAAKNFLNPIVNIKTTLPEFSYEDISLFVATPIAFKMPSYNIETNFSFADNFTKLTVPVFNLSNQDVDINLHGSASLVQGSTSANASFETNEFDISLVNCFSVFKEFALKGKVLATGQLLYKEGKLTTPKTSLKLNGVSWNISNFIIKNVKGKIEAEDNLNILRADVEDGIFKVGRQTVSNIKGTSSYEHKKQNFYALLKSASFNDKKIRMSTAISKVPQERKRTVKTMLYLDLLSPVEVFETVEDFVAALSPGESQSKKDTSDLSWLRNFRSGLPEFMPNFSGFIYAERFETPIVSGRNFNAEFNLRGLLPNMKRLDGKIDARLENGIIHKLQETAEKQKALGVAFQPFVIMNNMERAGTFKMGKVLKDTPFERMSVSVDFNNGKMDINNFYVDGNVIAATVSGNVGWVEENLDLDIYTMFKNTSKRGVLSENLTDESGEPALAFRAYGNMSSPLVQMRSPKKTGEKIRAARDKGLRTNFSAGQKFIKEK